MAIKPDSIQLIRETCKDLQGANVLDLGCGDRSYEKYIGLKNNYIGIDVEVSGRSEENKIPDYYFDGENIPLEDESVDVILFLEVLEHVTSPEKLLPEIRRVLKPQGLIIFSVPFIWPLHEEPFDFRRLTLYGTERLFNSIDFKIISKKKLFVGWHGISKLFNSLAGQNRKFYFPLKLIGVSAKLFSYLQTKELQNFYLTNLVLAKKS